jgi:hypothetical protein
MCWRLFSIEYPQDWMPRYVPEELDDDSASESPPNAPS